MGFIVSGKGGGGDFENPEPGTHLARCYRIIDLGTQQTERKGKVKFQRKVYLGWEIPSERTSDGRPMTIGKYYTASLSDRATLRADLKSWRGRDFTDDEIAGFDLVNVLGKPCQLSLIQNGDFVNVDKVVAIPKGVVVPALENETVFFSLADFDQDVFSGLSEKFQEKIKLSPEYKEAIDGHGGGHDEPAGYSEDDDDIPF